MKIGILETGYPPGNLAEQFGDYSAMFAKLLGPDFSVDTIDVQNGALPDPEAYRAYLITGSQAGVYDELPWIAPLQEFIRSAKDSKIVGVCFGHQIMAEALGGRVQKSEKGWGAGLHHYSIVREEPWIDAGSSTISVPASHQDQVVIQPPSTEVVGESSFAPYAALAWTDRQAISFQFHPEFTPEFAKALIEKRYDVVTNPDAAIASLDAPNDSARIGGWIRRFLSAPVAAA